MVFAGLPDWFLQFSFVLWDIVEPTLLIAAIWLAIRLSKALKRFNEMTKENER